jgi:hypothetical protein
LEIGLLKLVQAGRLAPIEEALADLLGQSGGGKAAAPAQPSAAPARSTPSTSGVRTAQAGPPAAPKPTPFELDRMKRAGRAEPEKAHLSEGATALAPQPVGQAAGAVDWKQQLRAKLVEMGMNFTADAVENSQVEEAAGELRFTTPKEFSISMRAEDINKAVRELIGKPMRIKVTVGGTVEAAAAANRDAGGPAEDELNQRALANPEVQRFREVFGGQIRTIRNLKE